MKRRIPWMVAAIFATAFVVVLVAKRSGASNEINGVTQDRSGRRVRSPNAWNSSSSVSSVVFGFVTARFIIFALTDVISGTIFQLTFAIANMRR
jgi:hypothetical protein